MDFNSASIAYDRLAQEYDNIEQDAAFKPLRQASLGNLFSTFRQGKIIVDIGCGTGTEAIALAKRGVTVIGIDPSESMINIAQEKAKRTKLTNVQFFKMRARDLATLPAKCGFHRFDGAYSTFGSLNCEPMLEQVKEALVPNLNPGSNVLISVMNRNCAPEMLAYLFLAPSRISRRRVPFLKVPVGGVDVTLRMYSASEVASAFKPLKKVSTSAISSIVPPPHLSRKLPEDIIEGLSMVDKKMSGIWPLSRLGDYLVIKFVKK